MRADNNGEGGIMALLALSLRNKNISIWQRTFLVSVGLFGAALFLVMALSHPPFQCYPLLKA